MFANVLKKIRDCVRDGNLVVTQHAFEEMNDDDLLLREIEHCILVGKIVERQWDKEWRQWKYVVVGETSDGHAIEVVLKSGQSANAVIITTYLQ